jgi:hypothetical protein
LEKLNTPTATVTDPASHINPEPDDPDMAKMIQQPTTTMPTDIRYASAFSMIRLHLERDDLFPRFQALQPISFGAQRVKSCFT